MREGQNFSPHFSENTKTIRPEIARAPIVSEVAKALIEAGVDVNAKDRWGRTALHCAAVYNHLQIGRMLIDAGADVRAKDEDKETPLDCAKRNPEFAEMLQEKIKLLPQKSLICKLRNVLLSFICK